MENTNNFDFELSRYIGNGFEETPANDADTLDQRFEKVLSAFAFWKHMPRSRIRAQTFAERVEREAILKRIRQFEAKYGVVI